MLILHSRQAEPKPLPRKLHGIAERIDADRLRSLVKRIAIPRHFIAHSRGNKRALRIVQDEFRSFGLETQIVGEHRSLIGYLPSNVGRPVVAILAHLDGAIGSPGADDNGSSLAALVESARLITECLPELPVVFIAPNREEEVILGSLELANGLLEELGFDVRCAEVLEMVGYRSRKANSQRYPPEFRGKGLPRVGDFLAVLANPPLARGTEELLGFAAKALKETPVITVGVGPFNTVPHVLTKSDHAPFWMLGVGARKFTDTAEYRNPHYHLPSDLPETLDYAFLADATWLAIAATLIDAKQHCKRRPVRATRKPR